MTDRVYIHAAAALGPHGDRRPEERKTLSADAPRTPLKPVVKEIVGQSLRQASHFIELASVGALTCLQQMSTPPPRTTGVYLGTGLADVHKNEAVFRQVVLENGLASPFDFVNAANNMAAFYIARLAKLAARNYTLMQNEFSFECALRLALGDMRDATVTTALVGGVDEFVPPRAAHLQRLPLADAAVMGEGSGWLYLARKGDGALAELFGVVAPAEFRTRLPVWRQPAEPLYLLPGFRLAGPDVTELARLCDATDTLPYLDRCGSYYAAAAFGLATVFERAWAAPALVVHANRDEIGNVMLVVMRVLRGSAV